jgi:hypothetical protein
MAVFAAATFLKKTRPLIPLSSKEEQPVKRCAATLTFVFGGLLFSALMAHAAYNERLAGSGAPEVEMLSPATDSPENVSNIVERPVNSAAAARQIDSATAPPPNVVGKPIKISGVQGENRGAPAGVSHTGAVKKQATITSRGKAVPLPVAVTFVVPKGWRSKVDASAEAKKVSWDAANAPWIDVLEDMMRQAGTRAVIDWNSARVNVSGAGMKARLEEAGGHMVRKFVLPSPMTAREVARNHRLNEADFCRWNGIGPSTLLPVAYEVYLREPPEGSVAVANVAYSAQNSGEPANLKHPAGPALPPAVAPPVPEQPLRREAPSSLQPAAPVPSVASWSIGPGELSSQLQRWANDAGYQMVWRVNRDFEMSSYATFPGGFQEALRGLFTGLGHAGHPLRVTIFEGNRVIEIIEE